METIILIFLMIVGVLAAAYPISHTFENLEGGPPTQELQERNEKREGCSLFILIAAFVGCLIILLPHLMPN